MPTSPYLAKPTRVSHIMLTVIAALLPGLLVSVYVFGAGVLLQLVLASLACLGFEAAMLRARGLPLRPFLADGSAWVTAWLLALSFPPLGPWWLLVVASFFAIVVAKHLYGGLGNNPFNPAMVGFAVMIISFPAQMSQWAAPYGSLSAWEQVVHILTRQLPERVALDAVSAATPLDYLKTRLSAGQGLDDALHGPVFGYLAGAGSEWVAAAFALGGLYLLARRLLSWHAPVAMLTTLAVVAALFHALDPTHFVGAPLHLLAGASMLGAWFIVTDPVTGPVTPRGKLLFGAGVGLLLWVIRSFGSFPDGMAFAILLMNIAVPLIDRYTQPPVFGHDKAAP